MSSTLPGECWVITDQAAGNQRQALALAEGLGLPFRHLVLAPRAPWSWLSPRLTLGGRLALPAAQRSGFQSPWPNIAIGCGRSAALFTRMLRGYSNGHCYTAQILDPRIDPAHWDTVIAPRHDQLAGPNVLPLLGSLNPVDETWLQDGRDAHPTLANLPRPRIGVLMGGPRQGIAIDVHYATVLMTQLRERHRREGGSVLVVASRRTPADVMASMQAALRDVPGIVWATPDDGINPYHGVLGWADRLVVTPDSVNMLSEACAVGCAVQTLVLTPLPAKLARFHASLREGGLLHDLDSNPPAQQRPLRETASIVAVLRQRILAA